MTTLEEVRANLASAIATVPDWDAAPYIGEQVNPPMVKVSMPAFDPRYVFGQTSNEYTFRCFAYYNRASGDVGEQALDDLVWPFIEAVQDEANWDVEIGFAEVVNVGEVTVSTFGVDAVAEYFVRSFDVKVVL